MNNELTFKEALQDGKAKNCAIAVVVFTLLTILFAVKIIPLGEKLQTILMFVTVVAAAECGTQFSNRCMELRKEKKSSHKK